MSDLSHGHRGRRRYLPFVWAASAIGAAVLVLGVNGTLSAWTSAIITNSSNTVATSNAVILKESNTTGGVTSTCYSSQDASNSYTCASINKYGGTGTPLVPGGSQQVDVTFTNAGQATATSFKLAIGDCTQTPTANAAATPVINNLCTAGGNELTVAVSCTDGATYGGTAWTDLALTAAAPSALVTKTHTASLAPGSSWTCRFTVALGSNANVTDQGITVSQPLTWTLAA